MQDQINRRLNKIASDMDKQEEKMAIQGVYIEAMGLYNQEVLEGEPEYKQALQEAMRLHTYHELKLEKLQEEKLSLTYQKGE